ncbi:MAG: hypothetical protein M1830_004638, partial [Pleopsidium flavum]
MALQSQFNLSVELTNLIPFGPLLSTASRGLIHLLRDIRKSGSDIVAEEDLAEVFGRNRIEARFASTFRTAVRTSAIHKLSEIADIVLEAGAGPTVKRSLNEQAYLSTVIQLSLLTWTHELDSLARALATALERRVQGADGYRNFPDQETLKGTLRACREQTSGFPWELICVPVETRLKDVGYVNKPYEARPIPFAILQALLDAFTAVQYFPDERLIRMETWQGVVTIVIWAHHLLGFTVAVCCEGESVRFGQGADQVTIDCELRATEDGHPSIALLNAAQEVHFSLSTDPIGDLPLDSTCRHPALGYGNRLLSFDIEDNAVVRELAHRVVASCLLVTREATKEQHATGTLNSRYFLIPSTQRVLESGSLLFEDLDYSSSSLERLLQEPCLARCSWDPHEIPAILETYVKIHASSVATMRSRRTLPARKTFIRLFYILLAFAHVLDIKACSGLPLDMYPRIDIDFDRIRLPLVPESFNMLARLLLGSQYDERTVGKAALLSSWGWSIFLSSVNNVDPAELPPEISIRQGVPSRFGERKEWILDSVGDVRQHYGGGHVTSDTAEVYYRVIAQPGDTAVLQSLYRAREPRYFVGVSSSAFEVTKRIVCESLKDHGPKTSAGTRLGFRKMQNMSWRAVRLPDCGHTANLGDEAVVPDDTWCFTGLHAPRNRDYGKDPADWPRYQNDWVQ